MVDESGTKLDKIVISCEMMHLPASMIDLYEESLKQQRFLKSFFADNAVEDELWEWGCCKITEVQNQLWSNSSFLLPEYSKRQAPKRLPVV